MFAAIDTNVDGFDTEGNFEDFEKTRDKLRKASHLNLLHI
jgi:hypothetical protein